MADAPNNSADHGSIQADYYAKMNAVAAALDDTFNPEQPRKVGFFLAVFPFDEQGRFNYISNAGGLDVLAMLKDITARLEARFHQGGRA